MSGPAQSSAPLRDEPGRRPVVSRTVLHEGMVFDLVRDDNLQQDLRSVEDVDGTPMVVKANKKDVIDADLLRHGDGAVSLCLANYAAVEMNLGPVEVASRGTRSASSLLQGY